MGDSNFTALLNDINRVIVPVNTSAAISTPGTGGRNTVEIIVVAYVAWFMLDRSRARGVRWWHRVMLHGAARYLTRCVEDVTTPVQPHIPGETS